jgi:hypothetical protein
MIFPVLQCFEAIVGDQREVEGGGSNWQGTELREFIGHPTWDEDVGPQLAPSAWFCHKKGNLS